MQIFFQLLLIYKEEVFDMSFQNYLGLPHMSEAEKHVERNFRQGINKCMSIDFVTKSKTTLNVKRFFVFRKIKNIPIQIFFVTKIRFRKETETF